MPLRPRWMRSVPVLAVAALAAACGTVADRVSAPTPGSQAAADAGANAGVALVPGILIGLDSNPVTVVRGGSATVPLRVNRVAGFTGAVALSVDTAGAARGVRVTLSRASVPTGDTAVTNVTVAVDTGAVATTTPTSVRINATGTGVSTQTIVMSINVANPPGFTIAFLPGTAAGSVVVGQSGTVRVIVNRQGGFTGPVTLTADTAGLPRGFTLTQGATSGDTVTLNLAAGATSVPGNYTINLRGTGTGLTARTFPIAVNVAPVGTFTIGSSTGTTVLTQAGSGEITVPVRINRAGGFAAPLSFVVTGLPTGVTARVDSVRASDTTATLRFTIPATLAAGNYPVTVSAQTPGLANQTTTLTFTVSPAAGFTFRDTQPQFAVLNGGFASMIPLQITRTAGFSDSVTFTVTGAPTGLTITPTTIASGTGTTSNFAVTAASTLAPGVYPISIVGRSSTGAQQTFTTFVRVFSAANNLSFGFAFVPEQQQLTLRQGDSTTVGVNVVRVASLADSAAIVTRNVPQGLSVTLSRSRTAEGVVTARISAASDARPGVYFVEIAGATVYGVVPSVFIRVDVVAR
jgi:trimeric autotransporter adhesin